MSATISLRCPACNVRIKAAVKLLGHSRHCPACNRRFVVRVQPPHDSGPAFILEDPEPADQRATG